MFTTTKENALRVQQEQLAHYSKLYPHRAEELRAKLAAETTADALEPGREYDIVIINEHIPRGGWFESNIPEKVASEEAAKERGRLAREAERMGRRG